MFPAAWSISVHRPWQKSPWEEQRWLQAQKCQLRGSCWTESRMFQQKLLGDDFPWGRSVRNCWSYLCLKPTEAWSPFLYPVLLAVTVLTVDIYPVFNRFNIWSSLFTAACCTEACEWRASKQGTKLHYGDFPLAGLGNQLGLKVPRQGFREGF